MQFRQFLTRVFSVGIALILLNALYYVYQFLLNHTLSVVEYGILGQLLALTVIGSLPSSALGLFITRYIGLTEGNVEKQHHIISLVFRKMIRLLMYLTLPILLIIGGICMFLDIPFPLLLLVMMTVFVTIVLSFVRSVMYALHYVRRFALNTAIEVIFRIIVTFGVAYFTHNISIIYGVFLMSLVVSATFLLPDMITWFRYQDSGEIELDGREMRSQILPTILVSIFFAFVGSLEVLLIGRILDTESSGNFAALMLLGKIVLFLLGTIITIGAPYFADSRKNKVFLIYLYIGMFVITLLILGIFFFWNSSILGLFLAPQYISLSPFIFVFIATMVIIAWLMLGIQHLSLLGYKQVGYFTPFIFLSVFISIFLQERTFAGFIDGMFFGYLFGGVILLISFIFLKVKK